MTKRELLEMVEALPEDTASESLEKVADELEKIAFMASVQRGLDQADRGEVIPHSEVRSPPHLPYSSRSDRSDFNLA